MERPGAERHQSTILTAVAEKKISNMHLDQLAEIDRTKIYVYKIDNKYIAISSCRDLFFTK